MLCLQLCLALGETLELGSVGTVIAAVLIVCGDAVDERQSGTVVFPVLTDTGGNAFLYTVYDVSIVIRNVGVLKVVCSLEYRIFLVSKKHFGKDSVKISFGKFYVLEVLEVGFEILFIDAVQVE